jgi:hypothetical protein
MPTKDIPVEPVHVACTICMKEVPISEAIVPEATEYVAHFCGVECYDKWRRQPGNPSSQEDIPTSSAPI